MGATVAADMLEWFKREIGAPAAGGEEGDSEWARLIGLASQSPIGSNGVFFLPHMSGSFCPVLDPASCGAFVGLRNIASTGRPVSRRHRGTELPVPGDRPGL